MLADLTSHISTCLSTQYTSRALRASNVLPTLGLHCGAALLTGPCGAGKTSLVHALCRRAAAEPWHAYTQVVECRMLRGKRAEAIRERLERIFALLRWRQPAVVVLDDLDAIASPPGVTEDEQSSNYSRVAAVIKDVMLNEVAFGSRICVLATARSRSSLHQSLTITRGQHLFTVTLEIRPPEASDREMILRKILTVKRSRMVECEVERVARELSTRTHGYVARDLSLIVDRAVHGAMMERGEREIGASSSADNVIESREGRSEGRLTPLTIRPEHFDAALSDFTPAALHNVSLLSPGQLGWADVGGLREVKTALVQTLEWPAKYPELFAQCPIRMCSGLLLYGPPGSGKTLIAAVVAKEFSLNFISVKGPELLNKYIGASEQAVRAVFERAQSAKPCVLFFDEFDSLAPRRGHDSTGVTDRVVNQLLTQLDGVEGLEGVFVLAATSRPDLIDPALLRPGRLDKSLYCPIPSATEREEILRVMTRHMTLSSDVDIAEISVSCEHFTGADFKALLYDAQLAAIHEASQPDIIKSDTGPVVKFDEVGPDITKSIPVASSLCPNAKNGENPVNKTVPESITDSDSICQDSGDGLNATVFNQSEDTSVDAWDDDSNCLAVSSGVVGANRSCGVITVTRRHLLNAVTSIRPSVSAVERLRYHQIYEQFVTSRGHKLTLNRDLIGQRTTLA